MDSHISSDFIQGYRKVSPLFVPRLLINLAAGHVSMRHGFKVNHISQSCCSRILTLAGPKSCGYHSLHDWRTQYR
jgi:hypothetical protein